MKTKEKEVKKIKKLKKTKPKPPEKQEHISIANVYKTNWLPYLVYMASAAILSMENMLLGNIIANISFCSIYISHIIFHNKLCPLYYLHKYHHENNGLFSQIIEISLEVFHFMLVFIILPTNLSNEWIILFCALVYISVHYINYGLLHVNNVHALHHKDIVSNYGPDYYDVLFGTKHSSQTEVENVSHYIPNMTISFIIVYLLQQVCKYKPGFHDSYRNILSWLFKSSIVFFAISTFYLVSTNKVK